MRAACAPQALYQLYGSVYDRCNPKSNEANMPLAAQAGFYALAVYIATVHGDAGDIPVPKKLTPDQARGIRAQAEFVGKTTRAAHAMFVKVEKLFVTKKPEKPSDDEQPDTMVDIDKMLPPEDVMLEIMAKAPTQAAGIAALRHVFCHFAANEILMREVEIANLRQTVELLGGARASWHP